MKVLSINQFAKICRTTPRTIRFYEEKGLFKPAKVDVWTKYRYYTEGQAKDFLEVKLLQNFHIPLKAIHEKKKAEKIGSVLEEQVQSLEKDIEEKRKEISFLKSMQDGLFGKSLYDKLHNEIFGPYTLFGKTFKKTDYDNVGDNISEVFKTADTLEIPYQKEHLVFYHNREYQPKNTTIDVALICKEEKGIKPPQGYFVKKYPKTECLVYDYFGPYDYFILLYQKLFKALEGKHVQIKRYAFDYYVKSSTSTDSPYDTYTKLCFPLL